jgi:hypothetical protein
MVSPDILAKRIHFVEVLSFLWRMMHAYRCLFNFTILILCPRGRYIRPNLHYCHYLIIFEGILSLARNPLHLLFASKASKRNYWSKKDLISWSQWLIAAEYGKLGTKLNAMNGSLCSVHQLPRGLLDVRNANWSTTISRLS